MNNDRPFTKLRAFGFSVFPLQARSKKPIGSWKPFQKTIATDRRCQEWDHGSFNVAIATGKVSGCFVLDVDGAVGKQTLQRLIDAHGALPETIGVQTGKGFHYYFAYPADENITIRNLASRSADGGTLEGLDVRGDGGYVVAPPSIHENGSAYQWLRTPWECKLADAPDWLIAIVKQQPEDQSVKLRQTDRKLASDCVQLDFNDAEQAPVRYLEKALESELVKLRAAAEGSRNDALNLSAFRLGQLISRGLDESTAIARLTAVAQSIGLDDAEITATIQSGIESGRANPREAIGLAERARKTGMDLRSLPLEGAESTDVTDALEVIKYFGRGNLLHALSSLWHWDGSGVWLRLDDREVKKAIHRISAHNPKLSKNIISSILDILKTEVTIRDSIFDDQKDMVINCVGGELSLIGGQWQIQPAKRESYMTTQLPVPHDASADAPRFRQFLSEIFAGDADADDKSRALLEMMGYSLLRSCAFEKFVILIGAGANGKSVLLKVLTALLGYRNVSAVCPSQFDNRFQRAHLHGKLANIISELPEGGELADATLKAIVSGEVITAEHKHKPPFEFRPFCTCWFGTNHMPSTRDFSDAIYRRAIILLFNRKFEGASCDPQLSEKLIAELPGIFNMALEAIAGVISRKAFTDPASSIEAKLQWRMESDQVAQFLEECCALYKDYECSSQEVYARYQSWAKEAGSLRPLNRKNFTNRLKRFGVDTYKGTGGKRMLYGIRLLAAYEGGAA
ncbi:MAG: phage/plasmid primase, P4 family [Alphaproteobacteria bacterium]|nr:phage/plasmid primase, P4 family [Alphaproteobacteria bacterium]